MAIVVASNTTALADNITTAYTSGSFTSVTDRYYLVAINFDVGVSTVTSTNGITFTKIRDGTDGYGNVMSVWGGLCSSGSSGTITITPTSYPGTNSLAFAIENITGHDTTGTIVQSNINTVSNSGGISTTLSAITGSNGTYLFAYGFSTNTIEAGWTMVSNIDGASILFTGYKAAGDNTPSISCSILGVSIIGIEIKVASGGGGAASNTSQKTLMLMGYGI